MKSCRNIKISVLLLIFATFALTACNTTNSGVTVSPERVSSYLFSVDQLDGIGNYTPELSIRETADTVIATVAAADAAGLESIAFHLDFDSSQLTPVSVELGDFMGDSNEIVSLFLNNRPGYVPVGIAQVKSSGVEPRYGEGLLASIEFSKSPSPVNRGVSFTSPVNSRNNVDDLAIISPGVGTVDLHWTELNNGDYNNDGLIGVSDLTPVGQYFGQEVAASDDPDRVGLADGSLDGWILVDDITPIGQNYDVQLSGYYLYTDIAGVTAYGSGITITRVAARLHAENDNEFHPVKYNFTADLPVGEVFFTVRPVCAGDLGTVGPVSNEAQYVYDEVDPDPPSNVTALSDATTGHMAVLISWDASPSLDVREYVVERQLDSVPGVWTELNTVAAGGSNSLVDSEMTKLEEPYSYQVKAVDLTDRESAFVGSNSATPYVVFLPAPENLTVNNAIPTPNAIHLDWDAPGDTNEINSYRVYDADSLALVYTTPNKLVTDYTHGELSAGVTYNYYVVSVGSGGSVESGPSNTAGTTPSVYVEEIAIQSFTTSKTTHYYGASEAAANLAVNTDYPPDNVVWDAGGGVITGTGANVTWMPTMLMPAQRVTVSVTVHRGSAQDTAELYLYVVETAIFTTIGVDGGHYIDFTASCLSPLSSGGTISDRSFSEFATEEHAIIFDRWESS